MNLRLPPVLRWLLGGSEVSATCPTDRETPVLAVWSPPSKVRTVSPELQASAIIAALQDEGLTGVVPRADILDRYQEHCWMLGFRPIGTNALCEALGKACGKKRRVLPNGKKVTGYVIPEPTEAPWPPLALVIPNGNNPAQTTVKQIERARSGTSHAQA